MKINYTIILLVIATIFFNACETESIKPNPINVRSIIRTGNLNDELAARASQTIFEIFKNESFRVLVKNKVQKQFDGDYNIL